jgi:alanyl-tRNA synthetase
MFDLFISGQDAAHLFTTFGFPVDLTRVKVEEKNLKLNEDAVKVCFVDSF